MRQLVSPVRGGRKPARPAALGNRLPAARSSPRPPRRSEEAGARLPERAGIGRGDPVFAPALSFSWRFPDFQLRLHAEVPGPGSAVAYRWALLAAR